MCPVLVTLSRHYYCVARNAWPSVDFAVHVINIDITLGDIVGVCGFTKLSRATWVHAVVVDTPTFLASLGACALDDGVAHVGYNVLL